MSHKVQTANITNIARDVTKISSSQSLGTTGNNMNMKKKKKKKKKKKLKVKPRCIKILFEVTPS